MNIVKCDCKDWEEGSEQISSAQTLAHERGFKYTGKYFVYCPWCGEKLKRTIPGKLWEELSEEGA